MPTPKDAAPKKDARPGRSVRAKKAQTSVAPAPSDTAAAQPSVPQQGETDESKGKDDARTDGKQTRRTHQNRRDAEHGERDDKGPKTPSKNAERRERRERQQNNRKQRNNRFAPVEPSLKREELAAMKVAELREKARELELDPTGIKSPSSLRPCMPPPPVPRVSVTSRASSISTIRDSGTSVRTVTCPAVTTPLCLRRWFEPLACVPAT